MIIFRVWEIALVSLILWSVGQVNGLKADEPRIWWGKVIWQKLTIKRVALLPLTPVPRPPTIREEKRGLRPFVYGGPNMAIVKGQKIYVVDDMYFVDDRKSKNKRKLLECSMEGKILREIDFPKDAPEYPSGCLTLCNDLLWIGLEAPYAFAVDLKSWRVVEERRWKGKGIVADMFAMPDRTLYVVMPAKIFRGECYAIWQIIKVQPNGKQESQIEDGLRPAYVTADGIIYWVNEHHPRTPFAHRFLAIFCGRFGETPKEVTKITIQQLLKDAYIDWPASGNHIIGVIKGNLLIIASLMGKADKYGRTWMSDIFLQIDQSGGFKVIGEEPYFARPIRSLELPYWWVCEGEVYGIMREDVGEHSRFWLVKLDIKGLR